MSAEVLFSMLECFLRGESWGRSVLQLLVIDIVKVIVEGTIMGGCNFGDGFMKDEVGLVVNAHELAFEATLILGSHTDPLANILILEGVFG